MVQLNVFAERNRDADVGQQCGHGEVGGGDLREQH